MKKYLAIATVCLLIALGCEDDPVKPENHHPIIKSLTAFPNVVGVQDSVIIICNVYDPDGDTVVYDWITDGRLKIKGARGSDHFLYHTYENSRIVYPTQYVDPPIDTVWIQCMVRDVKGGNAGSIVRFVVQQDSI